MNEYKLPRIPLVFTMYRPPHERQDFMFRWWKRHEQNVRERWCIRKLLRWLREWGQENPIRILFK